MSDRFLRRRRRRRAHDLNMFDCHVRNRAILRRVSMAAWNTRNLLNDFRIFALTEDRVAAIQTGVGSFRNKELRAVGVGTGVGVCEAPGLIEAEIVTRFILELVSWPALSVADRIATLDHEFGDH